MPRRLARLLLRLPARESRRKSELKFLFLPRWKTVFKKAPLVQRGAFSFPRFVTAQRGRLQRKSVPNISTLAYTYEYLAECRVMGARGAGWDGNHAPSPSSIGSQTRAWWGYLHLASLFSFLRYAAGSQSTSSL